MKSIYLCGFMGCGKSHIGRSLSKKLRKPFVDLDAYIVAKEKRSIPEIFSQSGEAYFRNLEAEAIKELKSGYIVATGGGTLLNENTAEYANANGVTVFLDAGFSVCYERIKNDTNRPLVVNNTKEQLEEIFEKRRPVYMAHSTIIIKSEGTDSDITYNIIKKVKGFERNGNACI